MSYRKQILIGFIVAILVFGLIAILIKNPRYSGTMMAGIACILGGLIFALKKKK